MSNKLTTERTEVVHLDENGKPVGKFTAADRKNSREAVSALTNLALALQKANEDKAQEAEKEEENPVNLNFKIEKDITVMHVNDDERPILLNTAAMTTPSKYKDQ